MAQDHLGHFTGTRWDANQYLGFADHRLRPALELLARIPLAAPALIYDLGCGTGNVTRLIAERWPSAQVCGVDSSKDMLAKAAAEPARVRWVDADIRHWQPDAAPDLIFSNATLHWIENHRGLFPRLLAMLRPDGCLAVQMPLSWASPSHRILRETLADGGADGTPLGTETLRQAAARDWVEATQVYYEILAPRAKHLDIWETEYQQILEGEDAVLQWMKGTALRPILGVLDDRERARFLAEYARRLRIAYPMGRDGKTVYPFRRLFIVAAI